MPLSQKVFVIPTNASINSAQEWESKFFRLLWIPADAGMTLT